MYVCYDPCPNLPSNEKSPSTTKGGDETVEAVCVQETLSATTTLTHTARVYTHKMLFFFSLGVFSPIGQESFDKKKTKEEWRESETL